MTFVLFAAVVWLVAMVAYRRGYIDGACDEATVADAKLETLRAELRGWRDGFTDRRGNP